MSLLSWVYLVFPPPTLFTLCFYEHITDFYQICGRTCGDWNPGNLRRMLLWLLLLPWAVSCFSSLSQRLHCLCWCTGKVQPQTFVVPDLTVSWTKAPLFCSYFRFGTPVTNLLRPSKWLLLFLCPVFYLSSCSFKKKYLFVLGLSVPFLVVAWWDLCWNPLLQCAGLSRCIVWAQQLQHAGLVSLWSVGF